ncbi:MAG: threonine synthase [Lysobacteraceae bacterium]
MSYVRCQRGLASGVEYPHDVPMNLDPVDGRPVEMVLDLERLARERPNAAWYDPRRKDLWRFGGLLALDITDPADAAHIVSLGEGHTPELDYRDHAVAKAAGLSLWLKDEGQHWPGFGGNPTRSFKDRGMAMAVAQARRLGLKKLAVPTQGNAGDALVRYALAGGLDVVVAMPEDTPLPIMGSVAVAAKKHPGRVTLELVGPTIREAGALLKKRYIPQGWFSVATFQEPGWRIEGKKTLGLEMAEPKAGTRWSLPDAVIYPTGGGTGVLGMWKAWDELQALGLIDSRRPRMYCVQSEATTPLVRAFDAGADDTTALPAGKTISTGLNVPGGVGHFRVLQIIRASQGTAIAVSEADTAAELQRVWHERQHWISPEGAACLAALPQLLDRGLLKRGERVVAVNTGSLEKYLSDLRGILGA